MTRSILIFLLVFLVVTGLLVGGYAIFVPEARQGVLITLTLVCAVIFAIAGWLIKGRSPWWTKLLLSLAGLLFFGGLVLGFTSGVFKLILPDVHEWVTTTLKAINIPFQRENIGRKAENQANEVYNRRLRELEKGLETMVKNGIPLELIESARKEIRKFKEQAQKAAEVPKREEPKASPPASIAPSSQPGVQPGRLVDLTFRLAQEGPYELFWVTPSGQEQKYTDLTLRGWVQPTYSGHTWRVRKAGVLVREIITPDQSTMITI